MTGPRYSADNPFAPQQPAGPTYSPDNPFAEEGVRERQRVVVREPDNPLVQLGKAFSQAALALPRDLTRLVGANTIYYDRLIAGLEPEVGPATTPAFEAFAKRHPILNQVYRGLTMQQFAPSDVGIATIPADVQALAQTVGSVAGEFGTGLGEYKIAERGLYLGTRAIGKAAPKLSARAVKRVGAAAAAAGKAVGGRGTVLSEQIGGAVVSLPRQIGAGLGQQLIADPENFGDPESIGLAVLFGFTGALADGVAFSRDIRRRGGTTADRPGPPVPPAGPPSLPGGTTMSGSPFGGGPPPRPAESPLSKPVRSLTDFDVVNATPAELQELAKRAAVEQRGMLNSILGDKGRAIYMRAQRIASAASSSPEAAASALSTINRIRSSLPPEQLKELDNIGKVGYTPGRLRRLAEQVQEFTPEKLAPKKLDELYQSFAEVLMEPTFGRNAGGIYRLHRLFAELQHRGAPPSSVVNPIVDYMTAKGVERSEAMKAVVNRMVEITGDIAGIKKTRVSEDEIASGKVRTALEEMAPPADPLSLDINPLTGRAGMGVDPSLVNKLRGSSYPTVEVAVKELLQNSIDATPGQGSIDLFISSVDRTVAVKDQGVGMSPSVAINKFLNLGASGKSATESIGSYGFAKTGFIGNAEQFRLETIGVEESIPPEKPVVAPGYTFVPGSKVRTVISGSGEDWQSGNLTTEITPVPADTPTGTTFRARYLADLPFKTDVAQDLIKKITRYNRRSGLTINSNVDGRPVKPSAYDWKAVKADYSNPVVIDRPYAKISIYRSIEPRTATSNWTNVVYTNRGMFQWEKDMQLAGRNIANGYIVDVEAKVGTEHIDYPFTNNRESLKGSTVIDVDDFFRNISLFAKQEELDALRRSLLEAPEILSSGMRVIGPSIKQELLEHISKSSYAKTFNEMARNAHSEIYRHLKQYLWKDLKPATYGGFGVDPGYYGINIYKSEIDRLAKEAGSPVFPIDNNLILYNPFLTYEAISREVQALHVAMEQEALDAGFEPPPWDEDYFVWRLAARSYGTFFHEVLHQRARDHDVPFSSAFTESQGISVMVGNKLLPKIEAAWREALEGGISHDTAEITEQWTKASIFDKIGEEEASDVTGPSGGDAPRGTPPQRPVPGAEGAAPSSGGQRRLSRGAMAPPSTRTPAPGVPPGNVGGAAGGRSDLVDPVEAANAESGERFKRFGVDPFERSIDMGGLPPYSRNIQSQIVPGPRPERSTSTWFKPWDTAIADVVDRLHALKKAEKEVGGKIPIESSPYAVARLSSGLAGKVHQFLVNAPYVPDINGGVTFTGNKSLAQILVPMRGRLNDYRRTLVAMRAKELEAEGVQTGFDPQDVELELSNAKPDVTQAARETFSMLRDVRRYAEEFGLMDPEISRVLDFLGHSGVSWERVFDKSVKRGKTTRYAALNVGEQFKDVSKAFGGQFKIVDPIQTTVDYVRRMIRASDLNRIGVTLVELAEKFPEQLKGIIEPGSRREDVAAWNDPALSVNTRTVRQAARQSGIEISISAAKEIAAVMSDSNLKVEGDQMIVRRRGKGEIWRVAPELGQALRGMGPQELNWMIRLAGYASTTAKAGITLDPTFAITQAFIGSFHATMQSKNGFVLGVSSMEGLAHRLKKSKQYQEFLAAGGAFGFIGAVETTSASTLRAVLPKGATERVQDVTMHPVEALRRLLGPFNEMNQMGEYLKATRRGKKAMEAALDAANVDTDFRVVGLKMQALSHMVHFLNPYFQGSRTFVQTFARKPNVMQLLGIAAIAIPSIYLWLAAEEDDEVRNMQRSPVGQANWLVRIGDQIVKIRKPILWGQFFGNTAELALEKMSGESPEAYQTFLKGIGEQAIFQGMPSLAQWAIGVGFNYDPLTGSPIVPERLHDKVEDRYQTTEGTSQLSQIVGDQLNLSPAKLDFAIRQLTGTVGIAATKALDVVIEDEVPRPTPVSADVPIINRFFVRYPSNAAEPIRTFYQRASSLEKVIATADLLESKAVNEPSIQRFKDYVTEHRNEIGLAPVYAETRREIAELREAIDEVRTHPTMSPERKRAVTDYILENMIDLAKRVNTAVNLTGRYQP